MQFGLTTNPVLKESTDCLIIEFFKSKSLSSTLKAIDVATGGQIKQLKSAGDLTGELGQAVLLHTPQGLKAKRLLLVGCGNAQQFDLKKRAQFVQAAMDKLSQTAATSASFYFNGTDIETNQDIRISIINIADKLYRFDQLKSQNKKDNAAKLTTIKFGWLADNTHINKNTLAESFAIASGMSIAKDLGNLPGNVCTPTYLANQAKTIAKSNPKKFKCKILEEKQIDKLGMHSFLSVTQGSDQPAKLITIEYSGGKKTDKPYVLVGKGITFDSGGISIKPSPMMDEMKYDMCGAASVLGVFKALSELKLPINVVGLIPTCENLPSGSATKPGDIVTSMSGQTIEILNTDAEGRLILCDALTYAERFKPKTVIDIATLTGACVIALGGHASGLMSNHQGLADAITKAGIDAHDRVWQLPLWEEYHKALESNFADMANVGGREGGTIVAGCFLSKFTEKFHWAHIDIAGTAWLGGKQKGATGRPVPLLMQYLINES